MGGRGALSGSCMEQNGWVDVERMEASVAMIKVVDGFIFILGRGGGGGDDEVRDKRPTQTSVLVTKSPGATVRALHYVTHKPSFPETYEGYRGAQTFISDVRVKGWKMHYVSECPHYFSKTKVCVCVSVEEVY